MATIIERAKTQLIIGHPFFASILLKRKLQEDARISTACIDSTGFIRYNAAWVEKHTVQNVVFLLAHECMHYMLMHCDAHRIGGRDPGRWNHACDAVINETLIESKVGEFIDGGVRWPGATTMSAEEIYELLPENEGKGGGGGKGAPGGPGMDIDPSATPLDPAEAAAQAAEVKLEVAQAIQAAQQMGTLPASLKRFAEKLLESKVPWFEKLARFMQGVAKNDYNRSRPNRRFIATGMYLPSLHSPSMDTMALIIDTSGSIGQQQLDEFAGHLNAILETCKPERMVVVYCDAEVNHVDEYSSHDLPVRLTAYGGGGTDMRKATTWVDENLQAPDCCVMLTDGYTPWPQHTDYPLVVACTTDKVSPVGETIRIN